MGSPKLQIIFHKRATKYRSLSREMTCKDKGSYESSPPCNETSCGCRFIQCHVTHMNESCHPLNESCHTYEWVMAHIWMCHFRHMNESCHTYEWVWSYIWMSYVTQCRFFTRKNLVGVVSLKRHPQGWMKLEWSWMTLKRRMSHVTHMNGSCHTYEWVMSHIWMSHVTHMNVSYHTYKWVMSHIWMSHVTHMTLNETWMKLNATWQKNPREQDQRSRFEKKEMALQMEWSESTGPRPDALCIFLSLFSFIYLFFFFFVSALGKQLGHLPALNFMAGNSPLLEGVTFGFRV